MCIGGFVELALVDLSGIARLHFPDQTININAFLRTFKKTFKISFQAVKLGLSYTFGHMTLNYGP